MAPVVGRGRSESPARAYAAALAATGPKQRTRTARGRPVDTTADRARILAGVTVGVARQLGVTLPDLPLLRRWGAPREVSVPSDVASPSLLGDVHEALLDRVERRRGGVFYTPAPMAATMAGWAIEAAGERPVVCDPAVGGGAFLLAAAERLAARGLARHEIVSHHLVGVDIDPVAAATAEAALSIWAGGAEPRPMEVADALFLDDASWPSVDVVLGNPPFLNQLGRTTARSRADIVALRERFGPAVGGYVDTAAIFLLLAIHIVSPGGVVAVVLPRSFLATRHAGGVRRAVLAGASLEALWLPDPAEFDADVRVCVPVLRRGGDRTGSLRRYAGSPPEPLADLPVDQDALASASTWSPLTVVGPGALPASGGQLRTADVLGSSCAVAADFRDQYYGLAPFVVDDVDDRLDDATFPKLVTSGLVDPAACRWGERPVRYHRQRWTAPRVDLARLEAESGLRPWTRARLVPKVLLATQTRVLEAVVDEHGAWLPSTPVISVVAPAERLWHVAAVLLAPPVTAWAVRTYGGAALSAGAVKLSASQVRSIPTPADDDAWDRAAELVMQASHAGDEAARRQHLLEAAAVSTAAYGCEDGDVVDWWVSRLPAPT